MLLMQAKNWKKSPKSHMQVTAIVETYYVAYFRPTSCSKNIFDPSAASLNVLAVW